MENENSTNEPDKPKRRTTKQASKPKVSREAAVEGGGSKKAKFYKTGLTLDERGWLDEAIALDEEERNSIEAELAAARVILKRLMGMEGSESKAVMAAVNIARLMDIRRRLEGKQAHGLVEAVDAVLAELGMGEEK